MKHLNKMVYAAAICGLLLGGCRKEQDQTPPIATISSINPAPVSDSICGELADNVIHLMSGEVFRVIFSLTDNENLGQLKVDIHEEFDCYGQDAVISFDPVILEIQDVIDISGTRFTDAWHLQVPLSTMAGNYHFQLKAVDAAGNESTEALIYTIKIRNSTDTVAPEFVYVTPPPASIARGQAFGVSGEVVDNVLLEHSKVELHYHSPNGEHGIADTHTFSSPFVQDYFGLGFTIPGTFATGLYEFEVKLYDNVGNVTEMTFEVQVQ